MAPQARTLPAAVVAAATTAAIATATAAAASTAAATVTAAIATAATTKAAATAAEASVAAAAVTTATATAAAAATAEATASAAIAEGPGLGLEAIATVDRAITGWLEWDAGIFAAGRAGDCEHFADGAVSAEAPAAATTTTFGLTGAATVGTAPRFVRETLALMEFLLSGSKSEPLPAIAAGDRFVGVRHPTTSFMIWIPTVIERLEDQTDRDLAARPMERGSRHHTISR